MNDIVLQESERGRAILIPQGTPVRCGRVADQNQVVLRDPAVSRSHCELVGQPEGGVRVRDLGSTSGTWIGEERLAGEALVAPGGRFRVGQVELTVVGAVAPWDPQRAGEPVAPLWLDEDHLLLREVGRGGMGVVFEAWRRPQDERVAVKWLRRPPGEAEDREVLARFKREVRLQASLGDYPGVVKVLDVRELPSGEPFCVQEFVDGCSLRDALRLGLPRLDALRIVARLARAIAYAHGKGVVHRDLKPANVLLTSDGALRLTDFGISKALAPTGSAKLTGLDVLLGTPGFMAPEQIESASAAGPPADVFSLGAILYQALTGQLPVKGERVAEALRSVVRGDYDPPRKLDPTIDPQLEELCRSALSLLPALRPTAEALAERLEAWLRRHDPPAPVSLQAPPPSDTGPVPPKSNKSGRAKRHK